VAGCHRAPPLGRSGREGGLAELRGIRGNLEYAHRLTQLRFRLASGLYVGKPSGARRVIRLDVDKSSAS